MVDPMTRLWNRKGILRLLQAESTRALKEHTTVGAIFIDVDHFKLCNDRYGHAFGDDVLRDVSAKMLGIVRECDAIGRFGGDEFLVVLRAGATIEKAMFIAQSLREGVARMELPVQESIHQVTVSVGVALCEADALTSPEALIEKADAAMYLAKRGGRNRVAA
jgi:diguanylate cyclase (GGDEF)-like protein